MLMDSDDDMLYEDDSGNEIDEDDEDFVDIGLEPEPSTTAEKQEGDEFQFDILTADEIVQHMVDCIREVNSVIQVQLIDNALVFCDVCTTLKCALLNNFALGKIDILEQG